jgi:carbamoyl-phosphate synthase large subunit
MTSAGGKVFPSMVGHLRSWDGFDVSIVAINAGPDAAGASVADAFYQVNHGDAPGYAMEVLGLCKANNVDVVVPLSDEEVLALSKFRVEFSEQGIQVLCSTAETTRRAGNKATFLETLTAHNLPTPGYKRPASITDLMPAIEKLGYPSRPVVCKPIGLRGGRGFRILLSKFDEVDQILRARRELFLSPGRLKQALEQTDKMPDFLVMEYLDGADYSVDVLMENGNCRHIIAQQKTMSDDGQVVATKIVSDPRIDSLVKDITSAFDFDYLINIDMAERNSDGAILPYEINVRPSALVVGTAITGVSLLKEAILQALEIESDKCTPLFEEQVQHMSLTFI